MKITEIVVSTGRTIPAEYQNYANFRPSITLKATLDEGDDAEAIREMMTCKAELMMQQHVDYILEAERVRYRIQQEKDQAEFEAKKQKWNKELDESPF